MILQYILAFTILITSVFKVTDVFIKMSRSLTNKHSEFIQKTQRLHDETGSISLMAALMTVMISALLLFFTTLYKVQLKETRYRQESYLCFHYLNIQTEKYITDMGKFNIALRALFVANFSVAASAQAKAAFEATALARNARHLHYIKNLLANSYCKDKSSSSSYLLHLPFVTSKALMLQTNIDETINLRQSTWTTTLTQIPNGIRFKNSFCLEANFQAEGDMAPKIKIKTKEISMKGFSKLKCLSGSQ